VGRPLVSVVVIARNEEARLGRALESVLAAAAGLEAEVIFVDSASTDATVAVAENFPVSIIGLEPDWPLCPAAGRHVGFQAARGEYVFFLDGDSALERGFLEAGLEVLSGEPQVAAVFGRRRELSSRGGGEAVVEEDHYRISQPREWRPLERIGGSGLYRAAALREVGGFNPWICSFEEAELCLRLYQVGHRLLFIPQPMISHLDHRRLSVGELRRRWRTNLLLGYGQVMRLHPTCWPLYRLLWRVLAMMGLLALLPLLALGAAVSGRSHLLVAWPALLAAAYLAFALRSKSLRKPLFFFLAWTFFGLQLARGMLKRPRDPADYPAPASPTAKPQEVVAP